MKTLGTICGFALLVAILSLPYGYYTLLRLFICGSSAYLTWKYLEIKKTGWLITFAIIAVLFNPIAPVYLDKGTWAVLDIVSAIPFFILPGVRES